MTHRQTERSNDLLRPRRVFAPQRRPPTAASRARRAIAGREILYMLDSVAVSAFAVLGAQVTASYQYGSVMLRACNQGIPRYASTSRRAPGHPTRVPLIARRWRVSHTCVSRRPLDPRPSAAAAAAAATARRRRARSRAGCTRRSAPPRASRSAGAASCAMCSATATSRSGRSRTRWPWAPARPRAFARLRRRAVERTHRIVPRVGGRCRRGGQRRL